MLQITNTDALLLIILSSGMLAGILAYLMVPSHTKEMQNCVKSMLFGIVFSLMSLMIVHFAMADFVNGVPGELQTLFLWCLAFMPAFLLALAYGLVARRHGTLDF